MIRAYKLYTGPDGHSHVVTGTIGEHEFVKAISIHFEESKPFSAFDWHNAPTTQFVITLAGILEFTMNSGESFTVHPGEILIALDTTGSGHKWRLVNDEPWKRAYVLFDETVELNFVADS